jgi:hypothetical protein
MSGRIEQTIDLLEGESEARGDERPAEDALFDEALDRRPGLCLTVVNYSRGHGRA